MNVGGKKKILLIATIVANITWMCLGLCGDGEPGLDGGQEKTLAFLKRYEEGRFSNSIDLTRFPGRQRLKGVIVSPDKSVMDIHGAPALEAYTRLLHKGGMMLTRISPVRIITPSGVVDRLTEEKSERGPGSLLAILGGHGGIERLWDRSLGMSEWERLLSRYLPTGQSEEKDARKFFEYGIVDACLSGKMIEVLKPLLGPSGMGIGSLTPVNLTLSRQIGEALLEQKTDEPFNMKTTVQDYISNQTISKLDMAKYLCDEAEVRGKCDDKVDFVTKYLRGGRAKSGGDLEKYYWFCRTGYYQEEMTPKITNLCELIVKNKSVSTTTDGDVGRKELAEHIKLAKNELMELHQKWKVTMGAASFSTEEQKIVQDYFDSRWGRAIYDEKNDGAYCDKLLQMDEALWEEREAMRSQLRTQAASEIQTSINPNPTILMVNGVRHYEEWMTDPMMECLMHDAARDSLFGIASKMELGGANTRSVKNILEFFKETKGREATPLAGIPGEQFADTCNPKSAEGFTAINERLMKMY
ncbi:MAG: hypothetical protein HQK50_18670 [Oligoflexia bacterium]|nr:hypothetical protein [Oligoflexia bacterium]MBF0367605.1 hypothetical protein [Oligoflexia bacterium]